jgi:hypothetical protein
MKASPADVPGVAVQNIVYQHIPLNKNPYFNAGFL